MKIFTPPKSKRVKIMTIFLGSVVIFFTVIYWLFNLLKLAVKKVVDS